MIIMLSVPLAVTGALIALAWSGISLNIYSQIGIIMLLGLMAKNGILIVEFANQLRDKGYSVRDAILEGATLRFRPVLMTTIDRKSTRLNSSHVRISYAVFCLKKKNT